MARVDAVVVVRDAPAGAQDRIVKLVHRHLSRFGAIDTEVRPTESEEGQENGGDRVDIGVLLKGMSDGARLARLQGVAKEQLAGFGAVEIETRPAEEPDDAEESSDESDASEGEDDAEESA